MKDRGFGFIICPGQQGDLFFHISECGGWQPNPGDSCDFEIAQGDRGPVARNVRPLPKQEESPVPVQAPQITTQLSSNAATDNSDLPIPYHFADIDLKLAIADTPVWHDGEGSNGRHTGKFRITLRALTPLLAGSERYTLAQAKPDLQNSRVEGLSLAKISEKGKKSILEPFRLADERIALTGKTLNGMVRHSLGALLSAPMERVGDRVYSYRPALVPSTQYDRLQLLPAVIQEWNGSCLKVNVLPDSHCVYFSDTNFEELAKNKKYSIGVCDNFPDSNWIDIPQRRGPPKHHIEYRAGTTAKYGYLFHYVGGIDGCGLLNEEFKKSRNEPVTPVHTFAAVKASVYESDTVKLKEISKECIQYYLASLEHIGDDQTGHLKPGHPLIHGKDAEKKIEKIRASLHKQAKLWRDLSPDLKNHLIYVEVDQETGEIRSLGHNYQYRWRYVDSVRIHKGNPRDILQPLDSEKTPKDGDSKHIPPQQLSGARLFCGYVSRREDEAKAGIKEGSDNIGKGRYQRLQGRIGCGFAVEYWVGGKQPSDTERFLGTASEHFLVPLKILGQPRPSELGAYLRKIRAENIQEKLKSDEVSLSSYGYLPASSPGQNMDEPGELAGRKFYRHQPDAAHDPTCYTGDTVADTLATLARFVSKPGIEFRFTLDFQDLRDWELGALLVTVFPAEYFPPLVKKLAADEQHGTDFIGLKNKLSCLEQVGTDKQQPTLAHKLGYGRPLGLGSVDLCPDRAELLVEKDGLPHLAEADASFLSDCIKAFALKLLEGGNSLDLVSHLERWAAVHRYAGLTQSAYPLGDTRENGVPVKRTYAYYPKKIQKPLMEKHRGRAGANTILPRILGEPNLNDLLEL